VLDAPAPVIERSSSGDSPEPPPPFPGQEPETIDEPVRDDAGTAERPADPLAELAGDANEPDADRPWEPTPPVPLPEPQRWPGRDPRPDAEPRLEPVDEADEGAGAGPEAGPGAGFGPVDRAEEEDDDVDRFSLAREFGRLLQRGEDPADG
jgi:hypothetical protein